MSVKSWIFENIKTTSGQIKLLGVFFGGAFAILFLLFLMLLPFVLIENRNTKIFNENAIKNLGIPDEIKGKDVYKIVWDEGRSGGELLAREVSFFSPDSKNLVDFSADSQRNNSKINGWNKKDMRGDISFGNKNEDLKYRHRYSTTSTAGAAWTTLITLVSVEIKGDKAIKEIVVETQMSIPTVNQGWPKITSTKGVFYGVVEKVR